MLRVRLDTAARPAQRLDVVGQSRSFCQRAQTFKSVALGLVSSSRAACLGLHCLALPCARRCVNFAMADDKVSYEPDTMAPLCVQLFEARRISALDCVHAHACVLSRIERGCTASKQAPRRVFAAFVRSAGAS